MPPIREVSGPGPALPPESIGHTQSSDTLSSPGLMEGSQAADEGQRLAALQSFLEGQSGPVDLASLAQTLIQDGAIRG